MKRERIATFFKGMGIGGSMMVPGVSGGSMAMILGIYDRLISAINQVFRKPKKNLLFLLIFVAGAVLGMVIFSKPLSWLMETAPYPVGYFFLGCVAGSVPMIFRKAEVKRFSPQIPVWILLGVAAVFGMGLLPSNLLAGATGVGAVLLQLLVGVLVAMGLVLPGISVMQMLALFGLYTVLLNALSHLDFGALVGFLPLVIGCVGGIFLLTGILERAMARFPKPTYLVILGFVLGSLRELYLELVPGLPTGWNIPLCLITLVLGFFLILKLSKWDV